MSAGEGRAAAGRAAGVRAALGLSSEQERVLDLEGSAGLIAGAGAGKTRTLVAAVLWDLAARETPPEEICVCTFTRASAAELRSRLYSEAERLNSELQISLNLEPLWLGTIDSICSRLIKISAVSSSLSPALSIGSERELRAIREEALEVALESLAEHELKLLDPILDWDAPDAISDLNRLLSEWQAAEAGSGEPLTLSAPRTPRPDLSEIASGLDQIISLPECLNSNTEAKLAAAAAELRAIELNGSLRVLTELRPGQLRPQAKAAWAELKPRFEEARQSLIDELTLPHREAAIQLLARWREAYEAARAERELADFPSMAAEVSRSIRSGAREPLWSRLYIDEAQDTSRTQTEILRGLLRRGGAEILIGDANQSIYSWRGADLAGFRQAVSSLERAELRDNYRSRPEIITAVNSLCGRVGALREGLVEMRAKRPSEPAAQPRVELWSPVDPGGASRIPSMAAEAEAVAPEIARAAAERGVSLADVCVLVSSNNEVTEYADALTRGGTPALAISKRGLLQRPESQDVISFLSALSDSNDEESLIRVLSSPIGALSVSELREIRSQTGAEQSLWVGLERERPQLHGALARAREILSAPALRAREAARAALGALRYQEKLSEIDQTGLRSRNVERLLDLVAEIERGSTGRSVSAITAELKRDIELGSDEPQDTSSPEGIEAVRVMTIHQAKGAEFPMVIAARLSRAPHSSSESLVISAAGEIGCSLKLGRGSSALDSVARDYRAEEKLSRSEEERRALYVALTRACEWLIIVGSARIDTGGRLKFSESFTELLDGEIEAALASGGSGATDVGGISVRAIELTAAGGGVSAAAGVSDAAGEEAAGEVPPPPARDGLPALRPARPLSYTALSVWGECGLRAYLERGMGLEPLRDHRHVRGSGARAAGLRAHREIAAWIRAGAGAGGGGDPPPSLSEPELATLQSELSEAGESSELSVEESFWAELGGLGGVAGQIDLIARRAGGESLIWDWKTGDRPSVDRYGLQRKLYAWSELRSGAARVRCRWVWLRSGEVESEEFSQADLSELERELEETASAVLSAPAVPAAEKSPEAFCVGCPGLDRVCPLSREPGEELALALAADPKPPSPM